MTISIPPVVLWSVAGGFVFGWVTGLLVGILSTRRYWARYFKALGR